MAREVRLTKEGYERLQADIVHEKERLEEATRILRELTGTSDDYDDSGLEEAKREKARIELRLDNLEDQVARAEIISASKKADKADLGSVIKLQPKGKKTALEIQLVSPIESSVIDNDIPKVSDESPLGKAVMGSKKGDTIKVDIGGKKTEYKVMSIS